MKETAHNHVEATDGEVGDQGSQCPSSQRDGISKHGRTAGASRSSAYRRLGWKIDHWTGTRIRIGEMIRRRPRITAQQTIKVLGPDYEQKLHWNAAHTVFVFDHQRWEI